MSLVWDSQYAKKNRKGSTSHTKLLVMLKLADHANDDGQCWPSQSRIAEQCGTSRETVNRQIQELIEDGKLEQIGWHEHNRSTHGEATIIWQLRFEDLDAPRGCDATSQGMNLGGVTSAPTPCDATSQGGVTPRHTNHHINRNKPSNPLLSPAKLLPLPEDWAPPHDSVVKARKTLLAIDVDHETRQFVDKARDQAWVSANWTARWRNWLRNAEKWAKEKMPPEKLMLIELKETIARGLSPNPDAMQRAEEMGLLGEVIR